jgi:RTX calcium-binding nonapeptide repeat (4 copies)
LGAAGLDFMIPGLGRDVSRGGPGHDFTGVQSRGADRYFGGPGPDYLTDFSGVDVVRGGIGNDQCLATADGSGGDHVRGGPGTDTGDADASDVVSSVEVRAVCFAE